MFIKDLASELSKSASTLANVLRKQLPASLVKRKNANNRQANFVLEPGVQLLRSRYSNQASPTTNNQEYAEEIEHLSLLLESALADNDRLVQEQTLAQQAFDFEYDGLLEDVAAAEAKADELQATLELSMTEAEKQLQKELAQAQVDLLVANQRNKRLEQELAEYREHKRLLEEGSKRVKAKEKLTPEENSARIEATMAALQANIEYERELERKQAEVVEQVRAQVFGDDSNDPLVLAATGSFVDVQAQPVSTRMAESVRKAGEALESSYNKAAEGTKRVLKALTAQNKRNQEPTLASLQSSFDAVTERRATKKANALLEQWSDYTTDELQQMADEGDATALSVVNERFADEFGYSSYAAYLHLEGATEAQEQEVRQLKAQAKANKRKPAPAKRVYKDYD